MCPQITHLETTVFHTGHTGKMTRLKDGGMVGNNSKNNVKKFIYYFSVLFRAHQGFAPSHFKLLKNYRL